jgi:ubiquinone/menaquinone biosynthesis C-methylase UbiE
MSSYLDRHAELYDLFYRDKPYSQEAAFVAALLRDVGIEPGARILELACGTGRHAVELAKLGYTVVGTDYSRDMLACAERRKTTSGLQIELIEQDMRDLRLPGPPFDAVLCFFDSIGYVGTNEALSSVLSGVLRHLRPGGAFCCEFWHAAAMLRAFEPVRVRRFAVPDGEVLRISETRLDTERQLAHVTYTIFDVAGDGRFNRIEETQTNRYFLVQEMAGWLERAGFASPAFFPAFERERTIDGDVWHVLAMARRP